jgi:hypothetical protein
VIFMIGFPCRCLCQLLMVDAGATALSAGLRP